MPTDKELQDLYRRAELAGVLDGDKELRDLTNRASAAGIIEGISGEEKDAYRTGKASVQLQGSAANLRRTPKLPGVTFRDPQTKKPTGQIPARTVRQGDVREADRRDEAFIKSLASMKGQTPTQIRAQDTNAPRFSNKAMGRDFQDMVGAEADALFMIPEVVRRRMAGDNKGAAKVVQKGLKSAGESVTGRAIGGVLGGSIQKGEGGAASRAFTQGALPGAGGLAGFSAGARVGASVPATAPVKAISGLVGGMVGAAGGGAVAAGAQRGLSRFLLGDEGMAALDQQTAIDQRDNPLAASIGQASTAFLFGKPTADDVRAIPQIVNMVRSGVPLRAALSSPAGQMLSQALRERAMEAGVEVLAAAGENLVTGKKMDMRDTGIQALSGALLPGENRLGRVFTGAGGRGAETIGGLLSSQRPLPIDFSTLPELQEAGNPYGIGNPLSDSGYTPRPAAPAPVFAPPPVAPRPARVAQTPVPAMPPSPIPQASPFFMGGQSGPDIAAQTSTSPNQPLMLPPAPPTPPDVLRGRLQEQQRQVLDLLRGGPVAPVQNAPLPQVPSEPAPVAPAPNTPIPLPQYLQEQTIEKLLSIKNRMDAAKVEQDSVMRQAVEAAISEKEGAPPQAPRPQPIATPDNPYPTLFRPSTSEEQIFASMKEVEPVLDIRRQPTGWKVLPQRSSMAGAGEVGQWLMFSSDGKIVRELPNKGRDTARNLMQIQSWAIDNPYTPPATTAEPEGELVSRPLYRPTPSANTYDSLASQPAPSLPEPSAMAPQYQEAGMGRARAAAKKQKAPESLIAPPVANDAVKEPWQMTTGEYKEQRESLARKMGKDASQIAALYPGDSMSAEHANRVLEAARDGKSIPTNVLDSMPIDYVDMVDRVGGVPRNYEHPSVTERSAAIAKEDERRSAAISESLARQKEQDVALAQKKQQQAAQVAAKMREEDAARQADIEARRNDAEMQKQDQKLNTDHTKASDAYSILINQMNSEYAKAIDGITDNAKIEAIREKIKKKYQPGVQKLGDKINEIHDSRASLQVKMKERGLRTTYLKPTARPRPTPSANTYDSLASQPAPSLPEPSAMAPQYQEAGMGRQRVTAKKQKAPESLIAPPVANDAVKEPWQMSRDEYYGAVKAERTDYGKTRFTFPKNSGFMPGTDYMEIPNDADGLIKGMLPLEFFKSKDRGYHEDDVDEALRQGKPVPAEVLADYPDLAQKYSKQTPAPTPKSLPSATPLKVGDVIIHNTTTVVGNRPVRREGVITALNVDTDTNGNAIHRYEYSDNAGQKKTAYISEATTEGWQVRGSATPSAAPGKGFASRVVGDTAPVNKAPETLTRPAEPVQKTAESMQVAPIDPLESLVSTFDKAGSFKSDAEKSAARSLWEARAAAWGKETGRPSSEFYAGLKSTLDQSLPDGALAQSGDTIKSSGAKNVPAKSPKASVNSVLSTVGSSTTKVAFSIADQAKVGKVTLPSGATFDAFGGPYFRLDGYDPLYGDGNAWASATEAISNAHHKRAREGASIQFTINNSLNNVFASHGLLAIEAEINHSLATGNVSEQVLLQHIQKTVNAWNTTKSGQKKPLPVPADIPDFLASLPILKTFADRAEFSTKFWAGTDKRPSNPFGYGYDTVAKAMAEPSTIGQKGPSDVTNALLVDPSGIAQKDSKHPIYPFSIKGVNLGLTVENRIAEFASKEMRQAAIASFGDNKGKPVSPSQLNARLAGWFLKGDGGKGFVNKGIIEVPTESVLKFFAQKGDAGVKAWYDLSSRTIGAMTGKSDFSSFVHESWHDWTRSLAPSHVATLERHFGPKDTIEYQENGARAFERYLRDGQPPVSALTKVFETIKTAMTGIYASIKGTPIESKVHPEIRKVFDEVLSGESQSLLRGDALAKIAASMGITETDAPDGLKFYEDMPKSLPANSVIHVARNSNGGIEGAFVMPHMGNDSSMKAVALTAKDYAEEVTESIGRTARATMGPGPSIERANLPTLTYSGIQSITIATDADGNISHAISPNGKQVAPIGTDEAKAIAGDMEAFGRVKAKPAPKEKEAWQMSREEYEAKRYEEVKERPDLVGVIYRDMVKNPRGNESRLRQAIQDEHLKISLDAMMQGQSVPPRNLPMWARTQAQEIARDVAGMKEAGNPKAESPEMLRQIIANHKQEVQFALQDGKPVPPEVLADYPDLSTKLEAGQAETRGDAPAPGVSEEAPTSVPQDVFGPLSKSDIERIAAEEGVPLNAGQVQYFESNYSKSEPGVAVREGNSNAAMFRKTLQIMKSNAPATDDPKRNLTPDELVRGYDPRQSTRDAQTREGGLAFAYDLGRYLGARINPEEMKRSMGGTYGQLVRRADLKPAIDAKEFIVEVQKGFDETYEAPVAADTKKDTDTFAPMNQWEVGQLRPSDMLAMPQIKALIQKIEEHPSFTELKSLVNEENQKRSNTGDSWRDTSTYMLLNHEDMPGYVGNLPKAKQAKAVSLQKKIRADVGLRTGEPWSPFGNYLVDGGPTKPTSKRDQLKAAQAEEKANLDRAVEKAASRLYSNPLPDPEIIRAGGKWLAYEVAIRSLDAQQAFKNQAEAIRTMAEEFGDWAMLHSDKLLESAREFWQSEVVPNLKESKANIPTWIEGDEALGDTEAEPEVHHSQTQERDESGKFVAAEPEDTDAQDIPEPLETATEAPATPEAMQETEEEQVDTEEPKKAEKAAPTVANPDARKLLTIAVQQEIGDEIGEDITSRDNLKRTWADTFRAAAEDFDALSVTARQKAMETPGALSEEERIVAAKLQQDARATVRELLDKGDLTPEEEATLTNAIAEAALFGRALVQSGSEAGRALNLSRALMDDAPGGFLRDVERAMQIAEGKLSQAQQRALLEVARRGERVQAEVELRLEARAQESILEAQEQARDVAEQAREVVSTQSTPDATGKPARYRRTSANPKSASYGKDNTVFTKDRYEAALAKLRKENNPTRRGATLNLGISPETVQALLDIGGFHFEAGLRQFSEWAGQVRADVGDVAEAHLQSAWLDVKAQAAGNRPKSSPPPKPSAFVDILESRMGRANAQKFIDAIAESDGEPVLLQKLIDGNDLTEAERKRIADAYRAYSPKRTVGGVTVSTKRLAEILTEFRKKSGYRPKPLTDAEVLSRTDKRLEQMAKTGTAPATRRRTTNPLIDQSTAEYAKGARSLEAMARGLEKRLGTSLPESMVRDLLREAAQKYSVEKGDVRKVKQELTRKIDAAMLANKPPLYRKAMQLVQAKQKLIALRATFDTSFFGRQGGKIVAARPDIGAKAFAEGMRTLFKDPSLALSLDGEIMAEAEIYGGADHWKKIGLDFTLPFGEENTEAGKLDGPIWTFIKNVGLERSEEANRTMLNRLRLDYFKRLAKPTDPIAYQKAMATLVNIMSSRAYMGEGETRRKVEGIVGVAHDWLQVWSPRNNLANVQFLAGTALVKPLVGMGTMSEAEDRAASRRAVGRVVAEYARYAATVGTLLAVLKGLGQSLGWDDWTQVETNPRSKDFGRVRVGRLELDFTSGWRKHFAFVNEVLGARQESLFDLTAQGAEGKTAQEWREPDRGRVLDSYARSMLNPIAGEALTQFKGRDFKGAPVKVYGLQADTQGKPKPFFDAKEAAIRAAMQIGPLSLTQWTDAIKEQGGLPDRETALWMAIGMPFEFIGVSTSVRDRRPETVSKQREQATLSRQGFTPASEALTKLLAPQKAGGKAGAKPAAVPEARIVVDPVTGKASYAK